MTTQTQTRPDYAAARKAMIDSQLRTSGVNEAFVLERMGTVAREDFVPDSAKGTAYMDRAIRLADGGFLPAPLFHGAMLAEARPTSEDKVLVVDAGSGYLPALVKPLVASLDVTSPDKAANAKKKGEYTLVLVDGAIEHIPAGLAKLVADKYAADGIRMNNILPGFIDSRPEKAEFRARIPMGRYGRAEEIAEVAAFLASDRSSYMTGQNLRVDGGITRSV